MPPQRITPQAGQESVWDYPRPPRLEKVDKRIQIIFNDRPSSILLLLIVSSKQVIHPCITCHLRIFSSNICRRRQAVLSANGKEMPSITTLSSIIAGSKMRLGRIQRPPKTLNRSPITWLSTLDSWMRAMSMMSW